MEPALVDIQELEVSYLQQGKRVSVVKDVSFTIGQGEIVGLVGESGCGKSVTSRAIIGMIKRPGRIENGTIRFDGKELTSLCAKEYQKVRGKEIAMIFQEPMTSLNPVYTIGEQLMETILTHLKMTKAQAKEHALDMLKKVGISMPEQRFLQYPGELSGGMRQRVMIAIALSCNPKLLIADEPTTALDVTIQAQILDLMRTLCHSQQMSTLVVTHDLGVVAELCQRVIVMYSGEVVEMSNVKEIFDMPLHPYTQALLKSIPQIGARSEELYTIPGIVMPPAKQEKGCRFHPRCDRCQQRCTQQKPPLVQLEGGQQVRCWLYEQEG